MITPRLSRQNQGGGGDSYIPCPVIDLKAVEVYISVITGGYGTGTNGWQVLQKPEQL